jgi:(p)ppGpp synthase/HD superfamily hydrolase
MVQGIRELNADPPHWKSIMARNSWSQDKYLQAYRFAADAHRGQTVPGTDLPYLMHVTLVSMEVIAALHGEPGHDENLAVQVALLHDVLEDTGVSYDRLAEEFGKPVADGVLALSKDSTLAKDLQMADSLRRIREQPDAIWMVKLADRITNLQPPPSYWTKDKRKRYQAEAREILNSLGDASDILATRLRERVESYGKYV